MEGALEEYPKPTCPNSCTCSAGAAPAEAEEEEEEEELLPAPDIEAVYTECTRALVTRPPLLLPPAVEVVEG